MGFMAQVTPEAMKKHREDDTPGCLVKLEETGKDVVPGRSEGPCPQTVRIACVTSPTLAAIPWNGHHPQNRLEPFGKHDGKYGKSKLI